MWKNRRAPPPLQHSLYAHSVNLAGVAADQREGGTEASAEARHPKTSCACVSYQDLDGLSSSRIVTIKWNYRGTP